MNTSLISILMPAYNAEKFIAEAIGSVLDQDHQQWELLVLDDASTDSTRAVINSFSDPRIKPFQHETNRGYLLSCNELFELAEGEFVTFLDADDRCSKDRLTACLKAFRNDPQLGFLTTDHIRIDQHGKLISDHQILIDYSKYATEPSYYPTICCATIFVRKQLLQMVGGYHPFFAAIGGEDYHWLFRLSVSSKGRHLNRPSYEYRRHDGQVHLKNTDPLKYFAKDIDQDIRARLLDGTDLLHQDDELRKRYESKIASNPTELHFRKAEEALNNSEPVRFKAELKNAIRFKPFSVFAWRKAAYLFYSHLARNP